MVIMLPYYETTDRTRSVLRQTGIDVRAQEGSGFLLIMDLYAAFLGFKQDSKPFLSRWCPTQSSRRKAEYAYRRHGRVLSDRQGSRDRRRQDKGQGFCTFHRRDFEKLSEGQRRAIFGQGYRTLVVQQTS